MPTYIFKIEEYYIVGGSEIDDEATAPLTLINIDKHGTGNLSLHAPDVARAKQFTQEHLRIHKNWDNPDFM